MKKIIAIIACAGILGIVGLAQAGGEHDWTPYKGTPQFEKLKTLTGTWEGTSQMGEGDAAPVGIEYSVTSNGSAVVEKLMPGTPSEMVSVYYEENGKLMMTHYCALGNQPKLELKSSEGNQLKFSLVKKSAINAKKDLHMHEVVLTFPEDGKISQSWVSYENGKPQDPHVFTFTKK